MSSGDVSRHRSKSSLSKLSSAARHTPPPIKLTPDNTDAIFDPCAATASFLLYAQRNVILVVHHDTLAIERRFDLHREDVLWISVDNVSERGSGRLAVSYDAGNTAIVWDILTGAEIARFSAYAFMKVATFMRNGNIAFGNDQGNIILFEPGTSEHVSARTIFDPITAIAPSSDCTAFAIGYLNGSILVATLQPSFTIVHTLTTTRPPSRITGLAWHGSSSKQKTDMLATQNMDGDLRVWSIPKPPHQEPPQIIRVLQRSEVEQPGPCWFAWSKNGRIVQHAGGETRSWDVRTKKVSWEIVPTVEGVLGVASYGPTATLFTLSRRHGVQQYDVSPNSHPQMVASAQHAPANMPPTPPSTLEQRDHPYAELEGDEPILPGANDTDNSASAEESANMSPLERIAQEMDSLDALESEIRDKVMPLSPTSSRASSSSSRSSGARRRERRYLYDKPDSSRASSTTGYEGTEFSLSSPPPPRRGHESVSIRSVSSLSSNQVPRFRSSNLRNQVPQTPAAAITPAIVELFPFAQARLKDVPFRTPHYGTTARTADLLQREMLSVVFGWNDTAQALIRDEAQRHPPGSASAVLLSKWLGDIGADNMAAMIGSESMTSSDWMLLALSNIGVDSQKKVGEAFVQRLLEKGDVHPAVAILLGLGENNDAIEVYVSQGYWLEAVLLTCLACPGDWHRISFLIRKWGEMAVQQGEAELAVRLFSCTSVETSEPWFSPRAQDAFYTAQQERLTQPLSAGASSNPPLSPPSRSGSGRLTAKNASLKLITTFGDKGAPVQNTQDNRSMGVTPIAQSAIPQSALSPGGIQPWLRESSRNMRDPASARTATPGGFGSRKRLPSRSDIERAKKEAAQMSTPLTASRDFAPTKSRAPSTTRRTSSVGSVQDPPTALRSTAHNFDKVAPQTALRDYEHLPSPAHGVFTRLKEESARKRGASRERKPDGLAVQVVETRYADAVQPNTNAESLPTAHTEHSRYGAFSPPPTASSTRSAKGRAIDDYISSVEQAREAAREKRAQSRRRDESSRRDPSRTRRATSRPRDASEARGRDVRYIQPAKRSPSSPIPMSPEEIAIASASLATMAEPATTDDEDFYKLASPVESHKDGRVFGSELKRERRQLSIDNTAQSDDIPPPPRPASRARSRPRSPDRGDGGRGRSQRRQNGSSTRSPSSPLPMPVGPIPGVEKTESGGEAQRPRLRSTSRVADELQARRAASRDRRERSSSRRPTRDDAGVPTQANENSAPRPRFLNRKELAAKELEERRLSLARRPSAPQIPLPGEVHASNLAPRPSMGTRANTELSNSPTSYMPPMSRSVDPEQMGKYGSRQGGTSTPPPAIGLPATPRAMRHPRYMNNDLERGTTPPVPDMPDNLSMLSSLGSNLSQVTGSNLGSNLSQSSGSALSSEIHKVEGDDAVGPLLPSTVFGQKGPQAPARSASAPPEKSAPVHLTHPAYKAAIPPSSRRLSGSRGHVRKISPPDASQLAKSAHPLAAGVKSIEEALAAAEPPNVVIVNEPDDPPILPELQHLAGPPPPPPPPSFPGNQGRVANSGEITIAIDNNKPIANEPATLPSTTYPQPMERASTASPQQHRRGRNSMSESLGSRFRGIGERMRSTSRNGAKSPQEYKPSPYESVPPPVPANHQRQRTESFSRAKSPYEQAMAMAGGSSVSGGVGGAAGDSSASNSQIPPPPPPPPAPGMESKIHETAIPPSALPPTRSTSAMGGYRNPKEIRANMPPQTLQQGVYNNAESGFL